MKFIWQTLWLRSSATRLQRRAGPAPERLTSHGSQLEGRLPCSSPLTPTPPLPAEILIQIFELLLSLNDVLTAYEALLDCSLVCKSWSHGAQITLLKHIEVVREEDAEKLVRHLGDIHSYDEAEASPVSSLSIGVQGLSSAFISRQTFGQLLGCTPRLQKLVIFQAKSLPDFPFYIDPPHLHNPTSLVDVTIASVGSDVVWTNVPHLEVLQHLPASVRFLQVLLPEPHNAAELVGTPHFSLYGLAMSQYPTSFAMDTRILHKSQQTLQCLTVWALRDIARLARSQPKLRSLKVVGPITDSGSLSDLQELERLETRFLDLPPNVLDSIPDSLQYLRFWSIDLAQSLGRLLVNKERLKKLQTVVWDYWFVTDDDKREGRQTIQSLREACASRDIGLRAYERSGDKLASQVGTFTIRLLHRF